MPNIKHYQFNKYVFNVNVENDDGCGIIITPYEHDLLNQSDYIEELRLISLAVGFIRAFHLIESLAVDPKRLPLLKILLDADLRDLVEQAEMAHADKFEQFSEQARQYLIELEIEANERSYRRALRNLTGSQKGDPSGYVYLIQSPTGFYKIGRTGDPANRLKTFGIKLPFEVEYVCLIETPNMHEFEKLLHQLFDSKRSEGEWFRLDEQDVVFIKSLAVQP